MSHWHGATSVPGPVDPDGCCEDQPRVPPTDADIRAGLLATAAKDDSAHLAKQLKADK